MLNRKFTSCGTEKKQQMHFYEKVARELKNTYYSLGNVPVLLQQ